MNFDPNRDTRFKPGKSGNPAGLWRKGQSGNPAGISRLQREFEAKFYAALLDEGMLQDAIKALKKAVRAGEPWAVTLFFSKALPAQPIDLRVSRSDAEDRRNELVKAVLANAGALQAAEKLVDALKAAPVIEVKPEPPLLP